MALKAVRAPRAEGAVGASIERTHPFVTVVMPVRNEAAHIERALASVLAQDYPPQRFEVIVVDGCSDDGTGEVVARLADAYRLRPVAGRNHPPDLFLVNNPARYVPSALNLALERARGDVIVRVDGHCEIAPNYFRACLDAMARTGADCVGGALDTVGETWMARAIALAQSSWFGVGGAGFRMKQAQGKFVDTLAFGAYRREVFQRIGPFDESLLRNQDDEFNFRLLQAGGKIWLDPEVHSVYYSRASLRGLCRQYFEYGLYKVLVIRKRGGLASWRHLVPATFVLGMTALFALGLFTDRWSPFWFVLGIYSAAAAVAATARSLPTWPSIPIVALAFSVMHVSYGIGFLRGIWKWRHVRIQR